MFEVYLVGTGGMKPLPKRHLTGLWLEQGGKAALVDCGEGMQTALAECGRSLAKLQSLLITHYHADHVAGLPGLLLSAGNFGKTDPLNIFAPKGADYILGGLMRICPELPFEVRITELSENGGSIDLGGITADYIPVRHTLPCFAFRFTEYRPPVFAPEKAKALNVPVQLWKTLHAGNSVELDGSVITPEMVCGEARKPLRVTYITDTQYFEELADFAADSEVLISEGMYGDDSFLDRMCEKKHMVFSESARIAAKSNSAELWLTHFSPALECPQDYGEAVRAVFPNTVIGSDGIHKTIK